MGTSAFALQRALSTDSTDTSFADKTPTSTQPSGGGVVDPGYPLTHSDDLVFIQPYGSNAENDTFDMRVWGWSKFEPIATAELWVPSLLLEVNVILGDIAQSTELITAGLVADTIVFAKGDADTKIVSPANDVSAYIVLDPVGHRMLEFTFDRAGDQEAESCNALYRFLSSYDHTI